MKRNFTTVIPVLLILVLLTGSIFLCPKKIDGKDFILFPTVTLHLSKTKTKLVYNSAYKIKFNDVSYKSTTYPICQDNNTVLVPLNGFFCKNFTKARYEYNEYTHHIKVYYQNHYISFYLNEYGFYADGIKKSFEKKPEKGTYAHNRKSDIFVPLIDMLEAFGLSYKINKSARTISITSFTNPINKEIKYTSYPFYFTQYAKKQYSKVKRATLATYKRLLKTSTDTTGDFKYLTINTYREVDSKHFKLFYESLIKDYYKDNNKSYKKSSLYKKSDVILKAAKKYNLDPVFFVCQTFHETGYGSSKFSRGITIKRVATKKLKMNKHRHFITKKLKKKKKVYNLYGIKAYDSDPIVGGTSYAYWQGWTSVKKAIYGAAKYLHNEYVYGKFSQNTAYKIRFAPKKSIWHQYATDPFYAENIGEKMHTMSSVYRDDCLFTFDYPEWK